MNQSPQTLALSSGAELTVHPVGEGVDEVRIAGKGGAPGVTITVTAQGTTVRVDSPTLRIEAADAIELAAPRVAIEASESLELASGDRASLRAGGMLHTEAHTQRIRSGRGDIRIDANDDLRLDGERVMVNCDQVK